MVISTKKIVGLFIASLLTIGAMLFIPAGTLDYWQGWIYIGVVFFPAIFTIAYFAKKDPQFLERRMRYDEKEAAQKKIVSLGTLVFIIGFLIPGLDQRYGWSAVPIEQIIIANIMVFVGYIIIIITMKENRFAARTVAVEKGQTVITSGPYSIVRHPMYFGVLIMYLATPIALGSYIAIIPFLLVIPVLVLRLLNEEEVLKRELSGYNEYCEKTRYHLIPWIW
ncbi:isoprenylcysteine carboxylmethyltransferase family protein [Candidatus Micrarchaeota archaeon]|nr:isoprenylcysteine carboxylmethyltransferase family protein [Candidatus Micrarchaeota archaeon]